jgi:rhamnulokinase
MTQLVAVDLGNESGRVVQIEYDNGRIASREIYRFANQPVTANGTLYWDVLRLWHEIEHGLGLALPGCPAGLGVDSFGVDFGLLDSRGQLIANPVHMRDRRAEGMMEWVFARVPRQTIFERTGIGFYVINTLYQLAAIRHTSPWQLTAAHTLLTMPNLLNFWLTGARVSEFTHTTTTQCYNPTRGDWDRETLAALDIPTSILPPIVQPGERIGHYQNVPIFAVAGHDTGSAVVAVPTETPHYAYISSGTWSLFGMETRAPVINEAVLRANITNEGGAFGTFRPLKLVMGLWILQQCRSAWAKQGIETDYERLLHQAEAAPPFVYLIDPDDSSFFPPGDMPERVRAFCQQTGQGTPQGVGAVVRCVLESLALKYRVVLDQLIAAVGGRVEALHIVGGGSQNPLLCQMTANATGRPVLAGPVEATALGNGLAQLIALGELRDLAEARAVVRASFPPIRYQPRDADVWAAACERFAKLLA